MSHLSSQDVIGTEQVLGVIRHSLWHSGACKADSAVFDELCSHTIEALAAPVLAELSLPDALYQQWMKRIVRTVAFYHICKQLQDSLPVTVPYAILKGTSSAQYYPYPEYRVLGDIDIITRREDFPAACEQLIQAGFEEKDADKENIRHRKFIKWNIMVEVHKTFSYTNDIQKAEYLDNLIFEGINPSHILEDSLNGLVLIAHISQHLDEGLGLRQIIDWMMFVNRCLPDQAWPAFQDMLRGSGLENLALVTTRMCEIYLGLPGRNWCAGADEDLCRKLFDYVMSCGNFGSKWSYEETIGVRTLTHYGSPLHAVKLLQIYGLKNWKAARKHAFLRPFAWLYQAGRYLRRGMKRSNAISRIQEDRRVARQRKELFDALGVKQNAQGVIVYRDGHYVRDIG